MGFTRTKKTIFAEHILNGIIKGVHRNEKTNKAICFFNGKRKNFLDSFYVYINIELRKILHLHFYNVSETERIHHYQLCRHNTTCIS